MQLHYIGWADIITHRQLIKGGYVPALQPGTGSCPFPCADFGAHWSFLWVDLNVLKTNVSKIYSMIWQGLRKAERKAVRVGGRIRSMTHISAGVSKMLQTSAEGRTVAFKGPPWLMSKCQRSRWVLSFWKPLFKKVPKQLVTKKKKKKLLDKNKLGDQSFAPA